MRVEEEDWLEHYGIKRRSGRYPWGSGKDPYQRARSFQGLVEELRAKGFSDKEIAKAFSSTDPKVPPFTVANLRDSISIARNEVKRADMNQAVKLRQKGWSPTEIGRHMGKNESSIRSLLAAYEKDKVDILTATSDMLRDQVSRKGFIDVGTGVENHVGVSKERLRAAISLLKSEGYEVHPTLIPQLGTAPGQMTKTNVLAPPGTTYVDIKKNQHKIQQISEMSNDGGRSFYGLLPPKSIDSKRIAVRYGSEGGAKEDGLIYVRPGVEDVSLGNARYAQVRIMVDGTHYLKGMALYTNDMPRGVDLVFNTKKERGKSKLDAMKKISDDPDNPFGAVVNQIGDRDEKGHLKNVTSSMNIVNEEGDWDRWSRTLASQTLSKQSLRLAKTQLDMRYEQKKNEFDSINAVNNPVVKRKLMNSFADSADSSAVHLEAARLPRSSWHVLLPFNSVKDTEVYAPNFGDGERVALIRYPHGGKFEIPELTVNNKISKVKAILGNAPDAIGINSNVAARLSGADFDGDAVMVIPNNSGSIKSSPAIADLQNFDPQDRYKGYEGMKKMTEREKALQMGQVSNLITDMTLHKASTAEIVRAVKHSMVVIDAEKHGLDWKQSEKDHGILQLKEKYQGSARAGASTLISRANAKVRIPEQKLRKFSEGGPVDPKTGELVYKPTGVMKKKKDPITGEWYETDKPVLMISRGAAVVKDAHTLSSGTAMESVYADHSNKLKALANEARKIAVNAPNMKVDASAKKVYAPEVAQLKADLNRVIANRPLERQAQIVAGAIVSMKKQSNPDMSDELEKRITAQALTEARLRTGAEKFKVSITPRQWEAIQAGAVSTNVLEQILDRTDLDRVKELATPKIMKGMTPAKLARAQSLLNAGYTQAEVAAVLGVSVSTLRSAIA